MIFKGKDTGKMIIPPSFNLKSIKFLRMMNDLIFVKYFTQHIVAAFEHD